MRWPHAIVDSQNGIWDAQKVVLGGPGRPWGRLGRLLGGLGGPWKASQNKIDSQSDFKTPKRNCTLLLGVGFGGSKRRKINQKTEQKMKSEKDAIKLGSRAAQCPFLVRIPQRERDFQKRHKTTLGGKQVPKGLPKRPKIAKKLGPENDENFDRKKSRPG